MDQPTPNILFASDLSKAMKHVFEQAAELALQRKANLIVLHVMEETPRSEKRIQWAFGEKLYHDLKSKQKQGARDILIGKNVDALKIRQAISGFFEAPDNTQDNESHLIEKILVTEGPSIADEVTSTALDEGCSMIVMGCKQGSMLAKAMSDNVVRKVLKRSPVPVLVVPFKER